eukprot:5476527-Prymnesium_polylepis.2
MRRECVEGGKHSNRPVGRGGVVGDGVRRVVPARFGRSRRVEVGVDAHVELRVLRAVVDEIPAADEHIARVELDNLLRAI